MKLYSNIHNQPEKPSPRNLTQTANNFLPNQSYNALNLPQQSEGSNLNLESNKPLQLGLTALNLYMLPSHISVVDEQHKDQQFQRVLGAATRSTTPRKKIFNEENILFKIMEPVSEQIKQQITTESTKNKSQMYEPQPPKDLTSYIQPREKTKISQTTNQMFDKRLDQSMRKISKGFQPQTKEQKQQTYRILAEPILHEERQGKLHTVSQSMHPHQNRSSIQLKIPEMLQRMDRNERAILQLKNQVNELIRLQNEKNINIKKELSYRERLMEQKHSNLQSQIRQLQNQQEFKIQRSILSRLQKQQANRMQELMEENKLLSQKIMEQRTIHRKTQPKEDVEYLRNKIAQLELQREAIQKDKTRSLRNLDISVIPHREQYFIAKPQLMIPTSQPPQPIQPIIIRYPQLNQSYRVAEQSMTIPDYRYHNLGIREIKVTKMF